MTKAKAKKSDKKLQLEMVPIKSLTNDASNARSHKPRGLEEIKRSLSMYGQQKPIVVDRKGVVVAGNGTLMAAADLGWTEIAVVKTSLKGAKKTGFAIADNRTGELSEWNSEALAAAFESLRSNGSSLDEIATGFSSEQMERIVSKYMSSDPLEEDSIPETPKRPKAKKGDLYVLGDHRLLCGDATREEDVRLVMKSLKADLVSTDPPYMVDYTGKRAPGGGKDWTDSYTDGTGEKAKKFYTDTFKLVLKFAKERSPFFVWLSYKLIRHLQETWAELGILDHQMIVWVKKRWMFNRAVYDWQHEQALFGWKKGKRPPVYSNESNTSVWEIDCGDRSKDHPTSKPVRLFGIPMLRHTKEGAVCYEPFCGSGSQIIAAEKLNRRCFAIEIEPAFIDVSVKRWEQLTGKKAKKQ